MWQLRKTYPVKKGRLSLSAPETPPQARQMFIQVDYTGGADGQPTVDFLTVCKTMNKNTFVAVSLLKTNCRQKSVLFCVVVP
jgi:hypothetical protein